jgi:hypothetical protein
VIPWECVQRVDEDAIALGVAVPVIPLNIRRSISDSD